MLENKISRKEWSVFGLILLAALGLRLYFFVGASMEDDLGFTDYASIVADGRWSNGNDQVLRRMTFLPISLAYHFFGIHSFSTHLYHMLCALISIVTAFFLARRFFGLHAALAAGLFLSFIPLHILYSSRVMPSLPETMWGGLAVWLLCAAEDRRRIDASALSLAKYAGVGMLIGVAYLCRETAVIMLAVPLAYLAIEIGWAPEDRRGRLFELVAVTGGFFVILGTESIGYYLSTHDWLHRWHIIRRAQASQGDLYFSWHFFIDQFFNLNPFEGLSGPLRKNLAKIFEPQDHYWASMLGLMGFAILPSVVAYTIRGAKGRQKIILLWFLAYFLFLSFGIAHYSPYTPVRKFPRYQLLYLTPACIMAGWAFSALWQKRKARVPILACAAILVGSSLYYTGQGYRFAHSYYRGTVELHRLIGHHVDPDIPIYLDNYDMAQQRLLSGYRPLYQFRSVLDLGAPPTQGAYIVIPKTIAQDEYMVCFQNTPCVTDIPDDWINVGEAKVGPWQYHQPDRYPVLFYVPPRR